MKAPSYGAGSPDTTVLPGHTTLDASPKPVRRRKVVAKRRGRREPVERLWIPSNLNAADILPKGSPANYTGQLHYFVHLLVRGRVLRKDKQTGYTRLKATYLRKVIPIRAFPKIRAAVINAGVVEWDPRYVKGKESMGYRLTKAYQVESKRVECRGTVARKIRRVRETKFYDVPESPEHRHLLKWLKKLDIDRNAAIRAIRTIDRLSDHDDIHRTAIEMIASGHVEFSFCIYGRVHSLVTRLARELRNYLRIGGEAMVNLDVKCSQPLLVAKMLLANKHTTQQPHNPTNHPIHHTPNPPPHNHPTDTVCISDTKQTQSLSHACVSSDLSAHQPEETLFYELCLKGELYEYMMEQSGMQHMPRKKFKKRFFCDVLYDEYYADRPMMRVFQSLFPNVARFIRDEKRGDYRHFSWKMQKLESDIIIGTVVRRLMDEYPHVPLITVHDSIATTPQYADLVRTVMLEEIGGPTIEVEPWSESKPVRLLA